MRAARALAVAVAAILPAGAAQAGETPAPWGQAAAYYDPVAFARAREALRREHGGQPGSYVEVERLEYQSAGGSPTLFLDGQGFWGTDRDKLWIKAEIERAFDAGEFEEAELQALWSRAIGPYFDLQAGLRHDFAPSPSRTHAVLGVQGLAPYWFEIDAAFFLSDSGDLTARIEADYEVLLTQRLVLQPRTELNFAAQDIRELTIGAGLSTAEIGARLRYEVRREFAPYVGVEWARSVGATADFVRASGKDAGAVSFVAGIRFWF
jgi:copper resistance protein B